MNIGVLGGTFDPVHNGHLLVVEEVRVWLNLAGIIFVPAGQPCLKAEGPFASVEHRAEMVRLAIDGRHHYELSTMEVERPGPSYMVDTIAEVQDRLAAGDELFLILGWDNLAELPQWHEPSQLITMCNLVAVSRPGYARPNLKKLEAQIPGLSQRVEMMDRVKIDISASAIRDRVARGLSIRHLVPDRVNEYIKQNRLYLRE
ncbi:MAG: nicotinate (nicotinamide) nucleotide adenylyltransferase [Dehalococcoidales bacterium]|nr:nicotinate (nicotinamide) nucleotide adenylyltransferase [Dehalococcoidales bacterium]|tara:strand:- start:755 stop:1360 length:606 start_codon:yes stop_codon:yes gene_type:complete